MFILFDFVKRSGASAGSSKKGKKGKKGDVTGRTLEPKLRKKAEQLLKPCLYKKR